MRQYEGIWLRLKQLPRKDAEQTGVRVSAPKVQHPRIIKAVVKEKWKDVGYKLRIEPSVAILYSSSHNGILTFTLHRTLSSDDF